MARLACVILPEYSHPIIQRGNRWQDIFSVRRIIAGVVFMLTLFAMTHSKSSSLKNYLGVILKRKSLARKERLIKFCVSRIWYKNIQSIVSSEYTELNMI